jgi:hypothetical protein
MQHLRSLVALALSLGTGALLASPLDALVAFDSVCIGTDGDIAIIERLAAAAQAKPAPQEIAGLDPAMVRNGGKAFVFKRGEFRFIIAATPRGACSLFAYNIPQSELKQLIERNYPLATPHVDASGPQTLSLYRINAPSAHADGYIMVNVPKPGFGVDSLVSIGYVPKSAAATLGARPRPQ